MCNACGAPEWFLISLTGTIHLRIPESSPVGTAIGSVKATDADTGKNAEVEYRIIDGDGTDMFDIVTQKDTQEGIITVRKVSIQKNSLSDFIVNVTVQIFIVKMCLDHVMAILTA